MSTGEKHDREIVMRLKEILASKLSADELQFLVGGYDVVGDVAITLIPKELEGKEHVIGAAILAANPNIRVLAKRAANYGGEFRTLPLTVIDGEDRLETELREFGIRLRLDVEKVYFSVRSGGERRRIAALVQAGEKVLVLFSGIAPYPLMISRYSGAERIVGVEKNPVAHKYGLINLKLNRRLQNIELIRGDAGDILPGFCSSFDRVVMVLPKSAEVFLAAALRVLRPGGWLHFYDMENKDGFDDAVARIEASCGAVNRHLQRADITVCGHCAPYTYRICLDCLID